MLKQLALLALSVGVCLSSPPVQYPREFISHRLPNTTIPTHYDLYLDTNVHIPIFEYSGNVKINITVLEFTRQIVLHSVRNVITRLELFSNHVRITLQGFEFDEDKGFLIVNTAAVLSPRTNCILEIDFTNSLDRNDRSGFYYSSYVNEAGETKYLAVTQFQATYARSSFPCYDEPGIKTTYDIRIACGWEYNATSNAPASDVEILPFDKKLTTFETTPRMQSYLVAFLVSDFVYERQIIEEPQQVAVTTLARPTASHLLTYSVDASVKYLRAMEDYFNQSYAMSKIDNAAIANADYSAGAMENWGLVTYAESTIFFNPETQGENQQVAVVGIVGHEYAHQFFGNLLAPKWWSYLWLNEGFAQFYQYYVSEFSHPELYMRARFINVRNNALNGDASATVRPMTYYAETPAEISRLFDNVAYAKSASVLRMFNYALTEKTFQKGIRYYIKYNKDHGVVEAEDLFNSLQQAAFEDAKLPLSMTMNEVFSGWSNQPGAPLVTIKRVEGSNEYLFDQERFFNTPQENPPTQSWWIPISYSTSSNSKYETPVAFWMPPGTSEVSYQIEGDLVIFNPLATGYYRVNYDEDMWRKIINQLYDNPTTIHKLSRSQLLDDSLHLAHAGKLDYQMAFELIEYLQDETEYIPWSTAEFNFDFLHRMLRHDDEALINLETYVAKLASKLLSTYGLEAIKGESADTEDARLIGLRWVCKYNQQCQKAATRISEMMKRSLLTVRSKTDQFMLCNAVKISGKVNYAIFLEALASARDELTRNYIIEVVGCVEDSKLIAELLSSLESDVFRNAEKLHIIQTILRSSHTGLKKIVDFLLNSSNIISERNVNKRAIEDLLNNIAEFTTDNKMAAHVLEIVRRDAPNLLTTIQIKLEENRDWIKRNAAVVLRILREKTLNL